MVDRVRTPVRKALEILTALAGDPRPMRLTDIAEATGQLPSTVLRSMADLLDQSWVVRLDSDCYVLGPAVLALARPAAFASAVCTVGEPALQDLAKSTGLMANLQLLEPGGSRVVATANPPRYRGVFDRLGVLVPITDAAGGIIQVACRGEQETARRLAAITSPADRRRLRTRIALAARNGFCRLDGVLDPLLSSVACPVFNSDGSCLAGIVTVGLQAEVDERLEQLVSCTGNAARQLEQSLRALHVQAPGGGG